MAGQFDKRARSYPARQARFAAHATSTVVAVVARHTTAARYAVFAIRSIITVIAGFTNHALLACQQKAPDARMSPSQATRPALCELACHTRLPRLTIESIGSLPAVVARLSGCAAHACMHPQRGLQKGSAPIKSQSPIANPGSLPGGPGTEAVRFLNSCSDLSTPAISDSRFACDGQWWRECNDERE